MNAAYLEYLLKGHLDERNMRRVTLDKVSQFIDERDFTFSPAAQASDPAVQWYQYALTINSIQNTLTRGDGSIAGTATATVKFNGTRIAIIGIKDGTAGKFDVSIAPDGITETVDCYSATAQNMAEVYSVDSLTPGEHILTITLRDDKNASSSNYYTYLDGLRVGPSVTQTQLGMGWIAKTYTATTDGSGNVTIDAYDIAPTNYSAIGLIGAVPATGAINVYPGGRYAYIRGATAVTSYDVWLYAAVMPK